VRCASVSSSTAHHPLRLARSGDPPRLSRARTHPASHRHSTVAAKPRSGGPHPPCRSFCLRRLARAINRKAEVPRMSAARSPWDDGGQGRGREMAGRHPVLPLDGEGGPAQSDGLEGVKRISVSSSTAHHPLRLARSGDPPRLSRARTHPASHRHPTVAAKPRSGGPHPPCRSFCLRRLARAINRKAEVPRMSAARSPWDDGGQGRGREMAGRHPVLPLDGEGGPAQSDGLEGVKRISVSSCTAHHPLRLALAGDPPHR
jgi:hypothetical protein